MDVVDDGFIYIFFADHVQVRPSIGICRVDCANTPLPRVAECQYQHVFVALFLYLLPELERDGCVWLDKFR